AEVRVLGELLIRADRPQPLGVALEAGRQTDPGPPADTGEDGHVLLTVGSDVGHRVPDDARGRLELPQLLARPGVRGLQIAFERAVEDQVAGRDEGTTPDRELLLVAPDDLALRGVPGDERPHVAAGARKHPEGRADVGLARRVAHLERLVV